MLYVLSEKREPLNARIFTAQHAVTLYATKFYSSSVYLPMCDGDGEGDRSTVAVLGEGDEREGVPVIKIKLEMTLVDFNPF